MSRICPVTKSVVLYLDCLECEEKECKMIGKSECYGQLSLLDVGEPPVTKDVCLSVGSFAKLLCSAGYAMGEKRLFQYMRSKDMLSRDNLPRQRYMELGYFKLISQRYQKAGIDNTYLKVVVTPKGQKWLKGVLDDERSMGRD